MECGELSKEVHLPTLETYLTISNVRIERLMNSSKLHEQLRTKVFKCLKDGRSF